MFVFFLITYASARPQFGFLGALERDIEIGVERGAEIGAAIAVERDIERLEGFGGYNQYGYGNRGFYGNNGYGGYNRGKLLINFLESKTIHLQKRFYLLQDSFIKNIPTVAYKKRFLKIWYYVDVLCYSKM